MVQAASSSSHATTETGSIDAGMRHLGVGGGGQEEASTSGGGVQARSAAGHRVKKFQKVLLEPVVSLSRAAGARSGAGHWAGSSRRRQAPDQVTRGRPRAHRGRLAACQARGSTPWHALPHPQIDLDQLRELAWSGIPPELRPLCWRLLLGYLPPNRSRQAAALARKRREYQVS
jgi:hypothetical protein